MEALCFKCSKVTNISEGENVNLSNGVKAISGVCSVCGNRVFRMVGRTRIAGVPASCSVCKRQFEGEFNINERGQITRFMYIRWDDDKVYCHKCFKSAKLKRAVRSKGYLRRAGLEKRIGEVRKELEQLVAQLV